LSPWSCCLRGVNVPTFKLSESSLFSKATRWLAFGFFIIVICKSHIFNFFWD
jgi:hypothetical protein